MKLVCWILFVLSVIALLGGIYARLIPADRTLHGLAPVAMWRAAMVLAVYSITLKVLGSERGKSA